MKILHTDFYGGPSSAKFLLDELSVCALAVYNASSADAQFRAVVTTNWEFLLRVQSEGLEFFKGTPEWEEGPLPTGVNAALWEAADGALVLKLRRRKHRRLGSTLSRTCSCKSKTPVIRILKQCHVCWLKSFIKERDVGTNLWTYQPAEFSKRVKAQLALLRVKNGEHFTCKAFRAGKATSMAKLGSTLGEILRAGEWRSIAVQRYLDAEAIDPNKLLAAMMEASDEEDVKTEDS